jgi:ribosomal protein S18 acetylase RimI-like enzyme
MVRPSRDLVGAAGPPDGYMLREFRDDDAAAYGELFRLAWPDEGTLAYTRAHALPGGFLVMEEGASGLLVGSCVAFAPETPAHPDDGSLGWLVVDPEHGGRGLGRLLAASVTNRLVREGYTRPWLGTEDDRLAAIGIYRALGWQPHLYEAGMDARWRDILEQLDARRTQ